MSVHGNDVDTTAYLETIICVVLFSPYNTPTLSAGTISRQRDATIDRRLSDILDPLLVVALKRTLKCLCL